MAANWSVLLFLTFSFASFNLAANVPIINELMASNSSSILDETGVAEDWVELYNNTGNILDLRGCFVSDNPNDLTKHQLDHSSEYWILEPGEFKLIWLSGDADRGTAHVGFSLSSQGESFIITLEDGTSVLDAVTFGPIPTDVSYGRMPEDSDTWAYFEVPTPLLPNSTEPSWGILDEPLFSKSPGFYEAGFELTLQNFQEDILYTYTTDGSEPGLHDPVWPGSIWLDDNTVNPNKWSLIPTNRIPASNVHGYKTPQQNLLKGNVVRIKAFKANHISTESAGTYFIFPQTISFDLPVFSLQVDSSAFFSDEFGIYVPGVHFETGDHGTGNYYQEGEEWERQANIAYFEGGDLKLSQDIGVRIHGGWSRRWPQKTLRIYARSRYGENELNRSFFKNEPYDSFKRLLLRNSGNDHHLSFIRDACAQTLIRNENMEDQAYRPSVLFLNGEYWGIHNIRERLDHHYLNRKFGLERDEIDLLTNQIEVKEGDDQHYRAFLNFVRNADWQDSSKYEELHKWMDLENYLTYYGLQVYVGNTDWPHNNIDFWRRRIAFDSTAAPGMDGRWRWMVYDLDRSFGWISNVNTNMIAWITHPTGNSRGAWATELFRELLGSTSFEHAFINRMADMLNAHFLPSVVQTSIDSISQLIAQEMPRHIGRWQVPANMNNWQTELTRMKNFANQRPGSVRNHIRQHFQLPGVNQISIDVSLENSGWITINSLDLKAGTPGIDPDNVYPWTGIYFQTVPIQLDAHALPGYSFEYWIINGDTLQPSTLEINLNGDLMAVAVFSLESTEHLFPQPYVPGTCPFVWHTWSPTEGPGTYPDHMAFAFMDENDPGLSSNIAGFTSGSFMERSRTRIVGEAEHGVSFINTGNEDGNNGYPGTRLGTAVLAVNTLGQDSLFVWWTGRTLASGSRKYNVRLQYAFQQNGPYFDIEDQNGNPVEYRSEHNGHVQQFGPVLLPNDVYNRANVWLIWRYYHTGEGSGTRDRLGIDNIILHTNKEITSDYPFIETLNPMLSIERLPSDCASILLDIRGSGGLPPYSFKLNGENISSPFAMPAEEDGMIQVELQDSRACVDRDSLTVRQGALHWFIDSLQNSCSLSPSGKVELKLQNTLYPVNIQTPFHEIELNRTIIAAWDFNNSVPSESPEPSTGNGTATLIGGVINPVGSGLSGVGSSDTAEPNLAWQTTSYPSQGQQSGRAGVQFSFSTIGMANIHFQFDQRLSNASSSQWLVQVCTDLRNSTPIWMDVEHFSVFPEWEGSGDTWYNKRQVELRAFEDLNNKDSVGIRIVSVVDSTTGLYIPTRWNHEYNGGTARFDMVLVTADPIEKTVVLDQVPPGELDIQLLSQDFCAQEGFVFVGAHPLSDTLELTGAKEIIVQDTVYYELEKLDGLSGVRWVFDAAVSVIDSQEFSMLVSWQEPGQHKVSAIYEDEWSCTYRSELSITVAEKSSGIDEVEGIALSVYPNPASELLFVELAEAVELEWELVDLGGRLLHTGISQEASFYIDISDLPPGMFFLRILGEGGMEVHTLVKV